MWLLVLDYGQELKSFGPHLNSLRSSAVWTANAQAASLIILLSGEIQLLASVGIAHLPFLQDTRRSEWAVNE